jgi:cathepsin L
MKIALLLSILVIAYALDYDAEFDMFKLKYSKSYSTPQEEEYRFQVFADNLKFVSEWDAEARGFEVGINKFADLSNKEFVSLYNGLNITATYDAVIERIDAPRIQGDVVNWVNKGAVTGVKNQGQCGSCWSFSTTGSVEGAHFLKTGSLVSLSEQNLVDCSTAEGNDGCNGGLMDDAFQYIIKNHGIDTEASYPYRATGPNACQFKAADVGATITSFHDVMRGSESDLQSSVDKQPVSVAIDAGHNSFQLYKSGVYYETACSTTQLDHGVLAVGYGTQGSTQYFKVKNSWGASWGESGYIRLARGQQYNGGAGQCGIYSDPSYPTQ